MSSRKNEGVKPSTILIGLSLPVFGIASILPTLSEQSISAEGYYVGHPLLSSINALGWFAYIGVCILTVILTLQSYQFKVNKLLFAITLIFYFLLIGPVVNTPDNGQFERAAGYYLFWIALLMNIAGNLVSRVSINETILFGGLHKPPIDYLGNEISD